MVRACSAFGLRSLLLYNMDDNKNKKIQNNKECDCEAKIKELEAQLEQTEENWKRALADYTNLKKRTEEESLNLILRANEVLVLRLLPVLDNLEKVESHLDDGGLKLVCKNLRQVLQDAGLRELETQDKEFNAMEMEAIDVTDGEKNKVIEVLEKGYLFNDKLIRPARVRIGRGQEEK